MDADTYLAHKSDEITVHDSELEAIVKLSEEWNVPRGQHGLDRAVMIARDNYTRELANHAARARLKRDGTLAAEGTFVGRPGILARAE